MIKIENNMPEQGTNDWLRLRLGHFTGSLISKLMVSGKKKGEVFGGTAISYLYKVCSERLLSESVVNDDEMFALYLDQTSVWSKAMEWGHEQEDNARELYEKKTGNKVVEISSVEHKSIQNYAASPDGVVEDKDLCIEIKCPRPETAVEYKATITDGETLKKVKPEYYWQCQAEMDCTDAKATDFIVYCPFLKEPLNIVTIERNQKDIDALHERINLAEEYIKENIIKS